MAVTDLFFGPLVTTFLIGITTLILLLWYSSLRHSYWRKIGVKYAKPFPLVGSVLENMLNPQHDVELQRYETLGAIYGHYEGFQPLLSVADPKLLRYILLKDFQHFSSRRTFSTGSSLMDNMLSNLEGENWKRVRTITTPAFSTGRLKRLLNIFSECSMTLINNFKSSSEKGQPVNLKRTYGAMAMDVIASSAFSTKINSHDDPENEFAQMARKALGSGGITWRFALFLLAPRIMKLFRITLLHPEVMNFFCDSIIQIVKERKRLGQTRNNFLQLLIDTTEEVSRENKWEEEKETDITNYGQEIAGQNVFKSSVTKNLWMDELVAQCVVFFLGGFDTAASTLSLATYFLALNQDIQEKARQDIKDSLNESKGELTYEAIQNMKYIDNVLSETLRLYPPSPRLERKADDDYKLGDTGITITKDMLITVPIYAIQRDSKYFPDPEKFDPDRFTAEERAKRDPYTYMPFGAGPRNCVGTRFALLEIKVCLIHVISHFNIKRCPQTPIPLKFGSGVGLLQPTDIFLNMEPRNNCPLN